MSLQHQKIHRTAAGAASATEPSFLAGGGEMGARMRILDWSRTPLGPPSRWPQSLKTIVRVMLDSRYAMWMLWGPEFTFFCNDAYLPTVGIKGDWVLGAPATRVWEEIWPDIGPRIARVLELGEATWDEGLLLFLARSGFLEETYHTFSYSPVYNDEDRIAGMLCVVTEVTERVIGERRLGVLRDLGARSSGVESVERSCARLCEVLSQCPLDAPFAAMYLLDGPQSMLHCVAQTANLRSHRVTEPLTIDTALLPVRALLDSGTTQQIHDLPALGIDVSAGPWPDLVQQALVLPIKGSGTEPLAGVLLVGVSPRRPLDDAYRSFIELIASQTATAIADARAFEAQRLRAEALAEIDRAKTTFFSNVSHEFRTPLTLMLGPVEQTLADPGLTQELRERFSLVRRNALRLLRLVNSLLDFARIEAGRVQASFERTDLVALTRDLASTFRSAIERAGLTLRIDCELQEPVYVDREMWEKIVLNLLSNAFKFTLEGEISVRLAREDERAVLTVADTGVGVADKEIPRLFDRFHRVQGTRARTQEGSGIGLALVQELVKLHGGTIDVSSTLGRGTTFHVRLLLGQAHLPSERLTPPRAHSLAAHGAQEFVQEALRWLPDAPSEATSALRLLPEAANSVRDPRFATTFGARVIVADDNADMRAYLRELLAPVYVVETAADGEQALAAAREQRPDLILTDVMMPHLDGFGLLAAIRGDESLRSVPVVLLSARAGEEARIEGFDAGADDYMTKPFAARELIARIGAVLELSRMRRVSEEELRRRNAQFQTLLNEAPLGVYMVDADFRIREMNPTAKATFGDIPDLIGRDFDPVVHMMWPKAHADEVVRLFRHTLETGEPYVAPEHIERRLDRGVTEFYEWQINRIAGPDGRYGVVCYFRDISTHILARSALQFADRQKDEFLAMLAHELRNPLAPIQNASSLLEATTLQEPRARFSVGVIKRQVTQLTRLVDDLLDVSRITQGRIELKHEPLDLGSIIAQAVEVVDGLFREKRHKVSIASGYQPLHVLGDNARLVQCIGNVLTNSAKYTDADGEIQIRSFQEGRHAVLRITDNGLGIPAELLPRIFDLFVQSERTLDRSQGGLGIGLSVVKRLIQMHGGEVIARSDGIDRGATFEIRLPLIERPHAVLQEVSPPRIAPRKVLIVDDNVDAADTLAMLLELEGHDTKVAYESNAALTVAGSFRPDIVLLDIGLPGMNGYEVARAMRAMPALEGVCLIALTGYGKSEDQQRTKAAGFDDHLVKPVEPATLSQALLRASSQASLRGSTKHF